MPELPQSVIKKDRGLELTATSASEELAKLRWRWTLDESNPKRVSVRQYARDVDRHRRAIEVYARGYALWRGGEGTFATLSEAIERAGMSDDRQAATEAVAEARGVAFGTARQSRPTEVKRVLDTARERAEKRGTTVAEEVKTAADWTVRSEKAARQASRERSERLGLRFIELEERLQQMRRVGVQAVNLAAAVEWGDEERELLAQTVANVKALLELVNLALVGAADVDWDAELASLEGESR